MKGWYHDFRSDVPDLWFWLLTRLPGRIGIRLRGLLIGRLLGACGPGTIIQMGFRVTNREKLRIGGNCNIGQGVFITAGGGVSIGDYVGIGPDAKIWSVNHKFEDPHTPWLEQGYDYHAVVIEDDVWIGADAFVKPGVTIGKGAIISAGTVLSKSVPAFAIVAGNPGRVVGWRKPPADQQGTEPKVGSAQE